MLSDEVKADIQNRVEGALDELLDCLYTDSLEGEDENTDIHEAMVSLDAKWPEYQQQVINELNRYIGLLIADIVNPSK